MSGDNYTDQIGSQLEALRQKIADSSKLVAAMEKDHEELNAYYQQALSRMELYRQRSEDTDPRIEAFDEIQKCYEQYQNDNKPAAEELAALRCCIAVQILKTHKPEPASETESAGSHIGCIPLKGNAWVEKYKFDNISSERDALQQKVDALERDYKMTLHILKRQDQLTTLLTAKLGLDTFKVRAWDAVRNVFDTCSSNVVADEVRAQIASLDTVTEKTRQSYAQHIINKEKARQQRIEVIEKWWEHFCIHYPTTSKKYGELFGVPTPNDLPVETQSS